MRLDIRLPIGLMFALLGALLHVYGMLSDDALYERSLGYNLNTTWGAVLFLFGVLMLVMSRRGTSSVRLAQDDPEGREMLERGGEPRP